MDSEPPLEDFCKKFFREQLMEEKTIKKVDDPDDDPVVEEFELPPIHLNRLSSGMEDDRKECRREIVDAAKEWGFFQIVNHGISHHVLANIQIEQVKLFRLPFYTKNFSNLCYRWGNPTATCLNDFSWSEAFHVPLTCINPPLTTDFSNDFSLSIDEFTKEVWKVAQGVAEILAENIMGCKYSSSLFDENCLPNSCYLRMNSYPPCPSFPNAYGLVPHTDSDFLTILYQDQLQVGSGGGLQLLKHGKWFSVKPNPNALLINVGDLFQAWSNGVYKSIQHRVVTNPRAERFSVAYCFCPSNETVIESCTIEPLSIYRKFSFGEYLQQVQDDVKSTGNKIGLLKFLK